MDSGAIANILRRPVAPAENPALERITLSVKLAVAVAAAQGRAELARELQSLAGRYPLVRLVQAPHAPARLEAGPFRWPIAAALRDALLIAVRAPASTSPDLPAPAAAVTAAVSSDDAVVESTVAVTGFRGQAQGTAAALPSATSAGTAASSAAARPTASAAAIQGALPAASRTQPSLAALGTGAVAFAAASQHAAARWPKMQRAAPPPMLNRGTAAAEAPVHRLALSLPAPLFDDVPDATAAAERLIGALRGSGLFTEAHLARALTSPPGEMTAETQAQRELARPPVELALGERTAAQLEVLRRDAAAVVFTAWSGQKASLDVGREQINADRGMPGADAAARVFFATLHLDLPRLGAVALRLRLVHSTVAAAVEAADPAPWRAALPELAAQLSARGLQTAALVATPTRRGDDAP